MGKKLEVPTYQFLKEPLIRKFGESFYEALDRAAKLKVTRPQDPVGKQKSKH
jgi:hypothetical protein